jgi:hypothetical protein
MEPALLIAGILLFAGVAASRLSDRLDVPAVLVQGLTLVPCARWLGVTEREGKERRATGRRDR